MGPKQVLPLRARVYIWIMAKKGDYFPEIENWSLVTVYSLESLSGYLIKCLDVYMKLP